MKLKHILSALGMALMTIGFWSCSDDETAVLKRDTNEMSFSFLQSTKNLYVLTNGNWQVSPSESWITCSPTSGTGSSTEQIVKVTVEQNDNTEREGFITLTDGVKNISIKVTQEDGFFKFGEVQMPEALFANEKINGSKIIIPYQKSKPGFIGSASAEFFVNGKRIPDEELKATPVVDQEMGLGSGNLTLVLEGTPVTRGRVTASISVSVNGNAYDLEGTSRVRLETEVTAEVFKLFPRLVVMDWGKYQKGTGQYYQGDASRDYDFELAETQYGAPIRRSVTSKANWFVNGMFWGENRFVYGNLTPEKDYWFRIVQKKVGANQNLTTDTTYVHFKTPAEPQREAGTIIYNDFDHFCIKGSIIYRAFGIAVSNAKVGANFDPNSPESFLQNTGICTPPTTMDPLDNYRTNATHNLNISHCPLVWYHYWELDKYGEQNLTDYSKYDGWTAYFARQSTGGVLLGGATTAKAYLGTPKLKALGDTPSNVTFITNTCAYHEPWHSWEEDCLYHYIEIEGPGTIVDGGPTKVTDTSVLPAVAEMMTDKKIIVKVAPNKEGALKGSINDWNVTTKHIVKISGATKDTRIKVRNMTPGTGAPHCRLAIDDVQVIKN